MPSPLLFPCTRTELLLPGEFGTGAGRVGLLPPADFGGSDEGIGGPLLKVLGVDFHEREKTVQRNG